MNFNSYLGSVVVIEQDVTVDASPDYSTGDLVGGKLTFDNLGRIIPKFRNGGLIQSVVISDLAGVSITKDVVFFNRDPSNTTFTENAALAINDTDLLNVIGVAQVADWFAFSNNSVGQALNLAIPFVIRDSDASLFAAIVERGTANYVSTADLSIRVGILPA